MIHARTIGAFEAIGSHWWVGVYEEISSTLADQMVAQSKQRAADFNTAYSRFQADSLVSILNRDRYLTNPPAELVAMIEAGEQMRRRSGGAFDLGVATHLENLGYDAGYSFIEKDASAAKAGGAFTTVSDGLLELEPDLLVDLGGLGKGWLIDKLASLMEQAGVGEFVVNGGGDIAVRGQVPKRFAIENPFNPDEAIGEIIITSGGLAASAPNRRAWTAANTGRSHHHLVNPATGQSHTGPAAVHTFAATATLADMAATAIYVMPPPKVAAFAKDSDVEFLIVDASGRAFASAGYPGKLY